MNPKEIAEAITEIAALLELKGENTFRVRAFENAARMLSTLERPLGEFVEDCRAGKVKGIGPQLSEAIEKFYERGHYPMLEELRAEFPEGLLSLLHLQGLGPKKVKVLYETLKVSTIDALELACRAGTVASLKGFGEKTQTKILAAIEHHRTYASQSLYPDALEHAQGLRAYLSDSGLCTAVEIAGSLRRAAPVVKDVDLLAATDEPSKVADHFLAYPLIAGVTGQGETKTSVLLTSGIAVDLRIVTPQQFPTAFQHFTGSKDHNTELRAIAKSKGLKLNEYGLFSGETPTPITAEADIYAALGLAFVPPECRENVGEIQFASSLGPTGAFPEIIQSSDLKGILHAHSTYSDGKNTLEEMAVAVRDRGYEYFGISDHSQSAVYAGGLKLADIECQHEEIDRLNDKLKPFRIFKGIEADILNDGALDYPDAVLDRFDFVIVSIHSRFAMSEQEMTARIVRALEHPRTTILAHPTGRLLLQREPYAVDIPAVLEAAAKNRVAVEINANPKRLDLEWHHLRRAKALGIPIAICPDAHSISGIDKVKYGVNIARKGWLTKSDILNTRGREEIAQYFSSKRSA
ncbi:MAG: DNA polymerase/3'-5' exonuclease PolX [Bdellovibrionota bacterium]